MKSNKDLVRGKDIMDTAKPVFKTIADGISKPMKFDHGGYHPANTYYVYLETNNPEYLQEHGFGDNPPIEVKADTIYEAIDHVKRNMPEDAEMSVISSSNVNKAKAGGLYAVGGMIEHGLMIGDTIVDEYKDYGIIKDKSGHFFVYDPNLGERKMINGSVYEQIMLNAKAMIDSMSNAYMTRAGLMEDGGDIEKGNLEMLKSSVKAIKHHAEELEEKLSGDPEIEAWVLAKGDRAATALSDITHYLDGRTYALGGLTPGRWYRDNENVEYRFIGKVDNGPDKDKLLFTDGDKRMFKSLDEFGGKPKENKLFGFFADGGETITKKFDGEKVLKKILSLRKKGYIVKKERLDQEGWYYKIQESEDKDNDKGIGIGYRYYSTSPDYKKILPESDYFYYNYHGKDDKKLGNVWNNKNPNGSPGKWYSFDEDYITDVINKIPSIMASGGKVPDDAIQSYIKNNMWNLKDENLILENKDYYDKKFEESYKNASDKVKKVLDEHIKEAKKNKLVLFRKGANINIDEDQILVFSETSDNEEGDNGLMTIYKNGNITHKFTRSPKREAAEQEEYRLEAIKNAPIFRKAKKELKAKFPSLPFSFSIRTSEMNVIVNDVEISWILGKENFILLAVRDGSKVRISKKIGFTENPSEFVKIVTPYVQEYAVMAKGGKIKNKILNLKSKLKK